MLAHKGYVYWQLLISKNVHSEAPVKVKNILILTLHKEGNNHDAIRISRTTNDKSSHRKVILTVICMKAYEEQNQQRGNFLFALCVIMSYLKNNLEQH